jgi:general nucleoside transport system ATP-binding protein
MNYVIEMLNICKNFGTLKANDNVTFQLRKGEVHALVGENGAGKSTLMSILFGLYAADGGEIRYNGEVVQIHNPNDANRLRIGMVHQHFKLVDVFTVLENIVLGNEDTKYGILVKKAAREKIIKLRDQYKLFVDPDALIKDITVGMQQRVEILKMLYRDADILIFDEPTAVLTPQEIDELMVTLRNFAKEGKSIIIITHKLAEVMAVADRCTVLRKGQCIGTVDVKDSSTEELAEMMVGRKVSFSVQKNPISN